MYSQHKLKITESIIIWDGYYSINFNPTWRKNKFRAIQYIVKRDAIYMRTYPSLTHYCDVNVLSTGKRKKLNTNKILFEKRKIQHGGDTYISFCMYHTYFISFVWLFCYFHDICKFSWHMQISMTYVQIFEIKCAFFDFQILWVCRFFTICIPRPLIKFLLFLLFPSPHPAY